MRRVTIQQPISNRRPVNDDRPNMIITKVRERERHTHLLSSCSFDLENRGNGYAGPQQQNSADYSSSHPSGPPADVSYASHLNTHNR